MIGGTDIITGQILTYIFKFAYCVFRQYCCTTDTSPYESGSDILVSSILRTNFTLLHMPFFTYGKYTFLYVAHFAKGFRHKELPSFYSTLNNAGVVFVSEYCMADMLILIMG
jgi:hypothetical protein